MATLDQRRAQAAYADVMAVQAMGNEAQRKYGSMVHALPALLRRAGLSQSLHFVKSRNNEFQRLILDHLAGQLRQVDGAINGRDSLLRKAREADLPLYARLSREALACITWYQRFVQGELDVRPGEEDRE